MGRELDKIDHIFFSKLEDLPHDIRRIICLLSKGMGAVFISRLIGRNVSFVQRKIKWIEDYFVFIYLRHQYKDKVDGIIQEFGSLKTKPGKLVKEAEIFKYMWEKPYLKGEQIAKRFNLVDPSWVYKIKNKYMKYLLEKVSDRKMHMLIVYFNRCVFLSKGKSILARKDFLMKRKPK